MTWSFTGVTPLGVKKRHRNKLKHTKGELNVSITVCTVFSLEMLMHHCMDNKLFLKSLNLMILHCLVFLP